MANRFYVTVFAADRRRLRDLQQYEFDLFRSTAVASRAGALRGAATEATGDRLRQASIERERLAIERPDDARIVGLADQPSIDGLLTLDEVARLVADGYRVLVERDAERVERAPVIGLNEWLSEMGERT